MNGVEFYENPDGYWFVVVDGEEVTVGLPTVTAAQKAAQKWLQESVTVASYNAATKEVW